MAGVVPVAGWNFLEYGLSPPDGSSVAVGWLICAVVFALMGGAPLAIALWGGIDKWKWRHRSAPITAEVIRVEESS